MQGSPLYLKDHPDGFLIENITAYAVHCIRGITYNCSTAEPVGYLFNAPRLRIVWINMDQHGISLAFRILCRMKQT